ncbi:MAG TPA: PAS domain S-box protein [Pyrinomonadaceae bacterium]|nr:PAS domain S-box protein [Pyrinomonadaceae bacterium]
MATTKKQNGRRPPTGPLRESEELFRTMADTAPVMIWMADAGGARNFFNKGWLDFRGRTMEQEAGAGWAEGVHPEDLERFRRLYDAAFDARRPYTTEYRLRRYDGAYRWILANGVPRHSPSGEFQGFIGTCIDIDDRRRAEEAQRASEELSQAVLNSLQAHIAVLDREGRVVAVNEAWRRFAAENGGAAPRTDVGSNYLQVCRAAAAGGAEGAREILEGVRAVLAGGRAGFSAEYACHSPAQQRWFMLSATPLPGGRGGAVVSHIDITDRKRADEALKEYARERERMFEEVSTPVVPVLEGVLVLPLIGSLDTLRMERATKAALQEVSRTGARAIIIDITGARVVDSHAVANLGNLVAALKLVGAEALVTGVGAQAAQSLVGLGLDLQGLRTHRTLAQALAALIKNRAAADGRMKKR